MPEVVPQEVVYRNLSFEGIIVVTWKTVTTIIVLSNNIYAAN